tara:strand:+ start:4369 stop:5541 length:1173 start_codon:yes stop_codon:yes gene_type:complete
VNFLKTNYFKIYLLLIFIIGIFFLYHKFLYPTDWTTSEWLINYQAGFVRRGLAGEILYYFSTITNIPNRYGVFYFEIILYGTFLYLIFNFFRDYNLNFLLLFIFFSPVFLIYPIGENETLVRKEYLFYCIYIIYLNLLINNRNIYLFLLISLPIMNLVWDGILFNLFFFFFAFLAKDQNLKNIFKFFLSLIPYLITLFLIFNAAKFDLNNLYLICESIKEKCFGAMFALDKSLAWSINYQISRFELKYLIEWTFIIFVSFLPLLLVSFYEKKKIKILNLHLSRPIFILYIICIFHIYLFMLAGYDWGRWVNNGFTFSILTFFYLIKINFVDIKKNIIVEKIDIFYKENKKISLFIFFSYIGGWYMKVIMTDDIGSLVYLRIIDRFFDYLL